VAGFISSTGPNNQSLDQGVAAKGLKRVFPKCSDKKGPSRSLGLISTELQVCDTILLSVSFCSKVNKFIISWETCHTVSLISRRYLSNQIKIFATFQKFPKVATLPVTLILFLTKYS